MTESADLVVEARWVIPVVPAGVIDHGAVAVSQGRIVEVCTIEEARNKFPGAQRVQKPAHALLPGFVNAHTHAAMCLMRGMSDDLPLMTWLEEHIWPNEARIVGPDYVRDGTELAIAEMIRSGTTCFQDMYFHPDVIAKTSAEMGMRCCVGLIVLEFSTSWASQADEYISKGLEIHDAYKNHPLISTAFAPHAPYTVKDAPLRKIAQLSDQLDRPVHIHVHETAEEIAGSEAEHGMRPLERMDKLGLVTPLLQAVHVTQVNDDEVALLADRGCSVLHCPESNLKLASGFCPVAKLSDAGINIAIGTDGAASNNDLDMLGEMRCAALLAKGVAGDATVIDAQQALSMATLHGARALGLATETGSLEAGKWADMCCIDLATVHTQPLSNVVSQIVYAASRDQVSDVWIGGNRQLADGKFTRLDPEAIVQKAHGWRARMMN